MRALSVEEAQGVAGGEREDESPAFSLLKFFFKLLLMPRNGWESTPEEKEFYEIYDEGRERYKIPTHD